MPLVEPTVCYYLTPQTNRAMFKAPCLHFWGKSTYNWLTFSSPYTLNWHTAALGDNTVRVLGCLIHSKTAVSFRLNLLLSSPLLIYLCKLVQSLSLPRPFSHYDALLVLGSCVCVFGQSYGINQMKGRDWACRVVTSSGEYCCSNWINGKWNGIWSHKVLWLRTRPLCSPSEWD